MVEEKAKPVPVKLRRRMRFLAAGAGPVIAWLAAIAIAAILIVRRDETVTVRGISEQRTAIVAPAVSGRLLSMPRSLLDTVRQGDVIAVLDDASVRLELDVIRAESALLQARVSAERERLRAEDIIAERREALELRRLSIDLGRAQLDALDRRVDLETARIELQRLKAERSRYQQLTAIGTSSVSELEILDYRIKESEKFIAEASGVLEKSEGQLEEARLRLDTYKEAMDGTEGIDASLIIAALNAEADVITQRLKSLESTLTALVLNSPFTGRVSATYAYTGSDVLAGSAIAEIVEENTSTVVAWLPDDAALVPGAGDEAIVRLSGGNGEPAVGRVEEVANAYLPLPARLLRHPQHPEYGLPVRIKLHGTSLPAGQKAQVSFTR